MCTHRACAPSVGVFRFQFGAVCCAAASRCACVCFSFLVCTWHSGTFCVLFPGFQCEVDLASEEMETSAADLVKQLRALTLLLEAEREARAASDEALAASEKSREAEREARAASDEALAAAVKELGASKASALGTWTGSSSSFV
jgi:hypothetical protein